MLLVAFGRFCEPALVLPWPQMDKKTPEIPKTPQRDVEQERWSETECHGRPHVKGSGSDAGISEVFAFIQHLCSYIIWWGRWESCKALVALEMPSLYNAILIQIVQIQILNNSVGHRCQAMPPEQADQASHPENHQSPLFRGTIFT